MPTGPVRAILQGCGAHGGGDLPGPMEREQTVPESVQPVTSPRDVPECGPGPPPCRERPNVIIVLTDDQCWGDLGAHGNPYLRTPNLDRLHGEGPRLERFYSCPVCAPTRASLMTGRYNYRTRAIDTYLGRAMMDPVEVTLAEILSRAGYRTGLFGKWHLGDTYPMRAMDKGFEEVLGHNGGGMCQPADFEGNTYFAPILLHNGQPERHQGYCTDIFTDAAVRFMEEHRDEALFIYLATNAPHSPLQIGDEWADPYRAMGLNDTFARVYGMIENIDHNVGKILDKLDECGLAENTKVMFIGDNGPCGSQAHERVTRYNGVLRDIKGSVYEGGICVPCVVRWPAGFDRRPTITRVAHVIDVVPTIAAACGAPLPDGVGIDGTNLLPLLTGEVRQEDWPARSLFTQWRRGDVPVRYRNCAVFDERHKLVNGEELYDLLADPAEACNVAAEYPAVVARMRGLYDGWFDDVSSTRPDNYAPPLIHLGTAFQDPVILTRQDWRVHGPDGWGDDHYGHWEVLVSEAGGYSFGLRFGAEDAAGVAHVRVGRTQQSRPVSAGTEHCLLDLELPGGQAELEAWVAVGNKRRSVRRVEVSHARGAEANGC